jgi:hypothetical protein
MTLPIWVVPVQQSIRSISAASRSGCDTHCEARHSSRPTGGYPLNAFRSLLGIAGGVVEPTYAEPG